MQLDADTHLRPAPAFLECVNHSCAPNVAFDMAQLALVALTDLRAGDELVYFYPSTEWQMAQPFDCACGAPDCLGVIDGAARLSATALARYVLSPFVRAQIGARTL
ncbi:MAG: SET domain-containing protein-lysine N-methyltransferase [Gemmatimonas sp.]